MCYARGMLNRTLLAAAFVLLSLSPALGAKNQGGGSPHYSRSECESLWWEIWTHYRDWNDEYRACGYGDRDACHYSLMYAELFLLSVEEYNAAGCSAYELGSLPRSPVISLPEPVLAL